MLQINSAVDLMNVPRIVIAGACTGVGKTTVSIGLMGALREAGLRVQAFKVGPDYIDPSYHNAMTGRPSGNLDAWMVPQDQITELFKRATSDVDIAIIEGVMGLYDGVTGLDETGSTAQIAKILRCPVVLIIDAHDMARTAAAVALGYKNFDENVNIAGIILTELQVLLMPLGAKKQLKQPPEYTSSVRCPLTKKSSCRKDIWV